MDNDIRLSENIREPLPAPAALPSEAEAVNLQQALAAPVHAAHAQSWGWLPALSLTGAAGLLLVSIADTLSRIGVGQSEALFWSGLLVLSVPVAARLASSVPSRRERLGLVILLGLGLYLVKVIQSPYGFTFSDELVHSYNAARILQTKALFNTNPILSVTPLYPGLETVTAALASLSGLSVFGAGLIVIGSARLILMLALYLFYEEVSGSSRLAGIATLLYTTNANFLYWSAQFSYESLALPLAALVLFAAVRRARIRKGGPYVGLTLIALLGITTVVITHHLTSYFLAVFFIIWTLLLMLPRFAKLRTLFTLNPGDGSRRPRLDAFIERIIQRAPRPALPRSDSEDRSGVRDISGPIGLAIFSTVACIVWLVGVASLTISYLSPVLSGAVISIIQIIAGEANVRQLFQSAGGYAAPVWERLTGIGSVLLMALGTPLGLRRIWRQLRTHPIALMLAGSGLAYFAVLGLRLSPAAWETGNRASEFLYIGLSFVLAFAVIELWDHRRAPRRGRATVLGSVAIILVGGVIAGWSPQLRLSRPLQVAVGDVTIEPQGFAAARWMRAALGTGNRIATDESNARLMLSYGEQFALSGKYPDIQDLLGTSDIPNWQIELMQDHQIQYVEVDRRRISADNMAGYYFDATGGGPLAASDLYDPTIYGKFDAPNNISRIFDSGNIVIYDTKAISDATSIK